MSSVRAAVVQAEPAPSLREGLDRVSTLVRDAAAQGAALVAFPETWLPGYPIWLDVSRDVALWDHAPVKAVFRRMAENSVEVSGDAARRLADIAHENEVTLVIGVVEPHLSP